MLQMTYQPNQLDAPVTTIWDLAQFSAALQGGLIISGRMIFDCYLSVGDIGVKPPIDSHSYNFAADQVSAFQQANNLQPGQVAAFAYAFAQSIQDTNGSSFFAGATQV